MSQKTVLITGVSSGLGRAFAAELLNAGFKVVGTVRRAELVAEFEAQKPGVAFARVLDVKNQNQITQAVEDVEKNIGAVDVLINNAGYGHEGILEESSMEELHDQSEVNVFGAVAMIKAVLPFMRQRGKGHIINVTSMGGLMTMPGISLYCGSKFALEGISSSLGKELKSFGIFVTALEPGQFRTDWGWPLDGSLVSIHSGLRQSVRAHPCRQSCQEWQPARRSCKGRMCCHHPYRVTCSPNASAAGT
jgi:short-subunit dehydrogenase